MALANRLMMRLLKLISILGLFLGTKAFPGGAGHCDQGSFTAQDPPVSAHGNTGMGPLEDNNIRILFGNTVLTQDNPVGLTAGQDYTIRIESTNEFLTFKGFLFRVEGIGGEDLSTSLTENNADVQQKTGCETGIAAMTHTSRTGKSFVEFKFNHPTTVPDIRLDVTVVINGGNGENDWFYSQYKLMTSLCPDDESGPISLRIKKDGSVKIRDCAWLASKDMTKREKFCTKAKFQVYKSKTFPASRKCRATCCGFRPEEKNNARFIKGTKEIDGKIVAKTKSCGWLAKRNVTKRNQICAKTVNFDTLYGQAAEICVDTCGSG